MPTQTPHSDRSRQANRPAQSTRTGRGTRTTADRMKRAASGVLGGVLLVRGLRRRSLRGLGTAAVGGGLLYRALGGNARSEHELRERLGIERGTGERVGTTDATEISRSITVGQPAEDLYELWRDPDQFSKIVGQFAEVTAADDDRLRWTVHGPLDRDVSWETRTVEEERGELLRWETTEGAAVPNEWTVRFRPAPGDRGTEVTLTVNFDPPGGTLGRTALEQLDMVPSALAGTALARFKSLAETGGIQTLEGNPSARGTGDLV